MTTILAVDDSNTMRKVLEITFAGEDFNVILAARPDQALGELRKARPPVALIDVTLPPSNGYELCQQIKAEMPGTRVLLLSSKQHPYDNGRGAAAGADDHLDKPFDTQALIEKVKALAAAPARVDAPARTLGAPPPKPADAPASRNDVKAPAPVQVAATLRVDSAPQAAPAPASFQAAAPAPVAAAPAPSVARPAATNGASLETKLSALGLNRDQVLGVLALSREIIEQAVWEVVPTLAETMIQEEIRRLTK